MSINDPEAPDTAPRRRLLHGAIPIEATRRRELGQVLPIFVIMAVVLIGGAALLSDVAWWWTVEQRMQRAADAAALAGAVYLPGNQTAAYDAAWAEAKKNGFDDTSPDVIVTPSRDLTDPRKLIVDIDGAADTHFAKVFCWDGGPCLDEVDVSVTGAAVFVLPVPMGSPQNYYGVGYLIDATTTTTTTPVDGDTGWNQLNSYLSGQWYRPDRAATLDSRYTTEVTNGDRQVWYDFRLAQEIPDDPTTVIEGIEVELGRTRVTGSGSPSTDCRVTAEISWDRNNPSAWSDPLQSDPIPTTSYVTRVIGSSSNIAAWGGHAWTRDDLADANFAVALTWNDGTAGCHVNRSVRVDQLRVRVTYRYDQVTITTTIGPEPVVSPAGDVLAPQNFWGALQSKGAPNIQGDAYMTYYDTRTSVTNDQYLPESYYHYAVEFPPGSSGGEVWLFDPGFCDVTPSRGTGEYWTTSSANGYLPRQPISTLYRLYDMNDTPYYFGDDTLVASSDDTFGGLTLADHTLNTASWAQSMTDCRTTTNWHNQWWQLASGLQGGTTYRLHTHSDDPIRNQLNSTGLNTFAIWSTASGGTPRVYGLGAMEAYVRLPGGTSSEFYLAQIEAEHAGKTMVISLWDPGDTYPLEAVLQILQPGATDYEVTTFDYSARRVSGAASNCAGNTGSDVNSVMTRSGGTGGTSFYNGCWLDIEIPLPNTYSAPHPSSDTVTSEGGWWKIRYNMSGSTSKFSTDLTTWQVELRGSPVHLVVD